MTATTDIDALLSAITYDSWFTIVAILADAYMDAGDEEAAEACRDIVGNGRRPEPFFFDGIETYAWNQFADSHLERYCGLKMVRRIDEINDGVFKTIQQQLTGFIAAWKEGYRP